VQHAHQKGIIHRDIKPSNVLVTLHDGAPVPKIIDFGIAKALGRKLTDKTMYTGFAQLVGTPLYMSPEQAELSGLDIDTRTDIYSLGVLLYELLTGTTPFDKERLKDVGYDELRRIIREEEPPKPSTRISTLGQASTTISTHRKSDPKQLSRLFRGELDWIVMKALEKDRNRRYETASAFAADVQRYLKDEPVQACPPSASYRLRKFARRNKPALAVAGLILFVTLLLGTGGAWWLQKRAEAEGEARAALREAAGLLEEERWREALSAARRAEGILAGVGVDSELRRQVHDLIVDLEMADRLQEARLKGTAVKDGHFDIEAIDRAYAASFADYGLDVDGVDAQAAAEQIRSRPIHRQLVAALDDWARVGRNSKREGWRQRLAVARAADPDGWRNRLRDALEEKDPKALEEASAAGTADDWPVSTVTLLGMLAQGTASGERVAAVLARAQQRHPGDFWINDELGFLHWKSQPPRLEEAIRYFTAAVALRPQSPGAHLNLGSVLVEKSRLDDAIAEYDEAIRLKSDYAEAWNNRGDAYRQLHQYDKALADSNKAIELDPKYAPARTTRGNVYEELHQYDKALADSNKAIELDPKYAPAWRTRGTVYNDLHQYDKALADLNKAIGLDPKNGWGWNNRGVAYIGIHQYDKALADWNKAIELDPKVAMPWYNRGKYYAGLHQYDKAIADYSRAIELDAMYSPARNNRGTVYVDLHQYDKALTDFNKAIELDSKNVEAWNNRGTVYHELHQYDRALADLNKAIELDPKKAGAWYNRGRAYEELHQYDKALADYSKAIELDPKFLPAWNNRGALYMDKELHQYDKALADLNKAIELDPKNEVVRNNLRQAEQMAELTKRLPAVLEGKDRPKDAAERLAFAWLCQLDRKEYAAAARFYAEAFAAEPKLAQNLEVSHRYNAACAAALAGCGQGQDAAALDAKERARLRRQALAWLRADLAAWGRLLEKGADKVRSAAVGVLQHWLVDPDFAGVRGREALAKLPEAERQLWQELWSQVGKTLARAQGENRSEKRLDGK
jgi:tetratricopeptide (TPR) repeat protein